MRIIPAIDIIDGKCVRLTKGDYRTQKVYNSNPIEVAKMFEDNGLKYLHLVDLDGAREGAIQNLSVLEKICSQTSLCVDFGGGVKSNDDAKNALNAGARQITAGSIAVKNPEQVEKWISDFGADFIILGADVKGNRVAINGWKNTTDIRLYDLIKRYQEKGLNKVISTDIATDGMLKGPSLDLYEGLLKNFPTLQLVASGGVSSLDDLNALDELGVDGVIIGKAIYENRIALKDLEKYVS